MIKEMKEEIDDGSLAFLKIPRDPDNHYFNCQITTQQKLINTTFWLVDFMEEIKTRNGNKILVKIKLNENDDEKDMKKFFTGSREIKYILEKIAERNAFPRKVTLRAIGNRYFFE